MEELDFKLEPEDRKGKSWLHTKKSILRRKYCEQMQETDLESISRPV